ncbi:MAG: thioredoxin [Flammeovirgaceae bacterium]|nr:thioredoxin [Flammeovirgaceae bacterium]
MSQPKKSFNEIIQGETPVLVDFHADWCGPCKMMAPILEQVSKELQEIKIIKVDVDKNPQAANAFRVQGVPTLILFRKGEVLWRQSGVVPAHLLKTTLQSFVVKA